MLEMEMRERPIRLYGDPNDPFASPDDLIRILRMMGHTDEAKLARLRQLMDPKLARSPPSFIASAQAPNES
jgi:hypothetical protein